MANESNKRKLLACAKRIAELEVELEALRAGKKAIEDNGGDAATLRDMASAIDRCTKELANQLDDFDALIKELKSEANDVVFVNMIWRREVCFLLDRKIRLIDFWMQNHREDGGTRTLEELFTFDQPDFGTI